MKGYNNYKVTINVNCEFEVSVDAKNKRDAIETVRNKFRTPFQLSQADLQSTFADFKFLTEENIIEVSEVL